MPRVGHSSAGRRDAVEPAIVAALERYGAKVARLSDKGVADLLVCYAGRLSLLECKSRHGRATPAQVVRSNQGWPVRTVRTVDDALNALRAGVWGS
jgi:hypothetical protein